MFKNLREKIESQNNADMFENDDLLSNDDVSIDTKSSHLTFISGDQIQSENDEDTNRVDEVTVEKNENENNKPLVSIIYDHVVVERLQQEIDEYKAKLLNYDEILNERNELKSVNNDLVKQIDRLENDLRNVNDEKIAILARCDTFLMSNESRRYEADQKVDELNAKITDLEDSLREKNKTIRLQQLRLNDIRRSFQKGDFLDSKLFDTNNSSGTITGNTSDIGSSSDTSPKINRKRLNPIESISNKTNTNNDKQLTSTTKSSQSANLNDINFQYLRNVVYKFVICSDYEAQKHLIKAISRILHFSDSEEKHVRETIDNRMSWFKSLPLIGN